MSENATKKFKKRPVVVEAYQVEQSVVINTLEGKMLASPGDWIVIGIQGEKYPVKPEIFEMTYEKLD